MLIRLTQRISTDLALSVRSAHTYSGYDNLDQFCTSSTLMPRRRQHDKPNLHRTRIPMINQAANPTPAISQLFPYDSSISSPPVSSLTPPTDYLQPTITAGDKRSYKGGLVIHTRGRKRCLMKVGKTGGVVTVVRWLVVRGVMG
jgi:hypothetical protein